MSKYKDTADAKYVNMRRVSPSGVSPSHSQHENERSTHFKKKLKTLDVFAPIKDITKHSSY